MSRAATEKISGPVGGSKGLESRCQVSLNRFCLDDRNNRATKRSADITRHPRFNTSTFHENDNLTGTFLTRLRYFTCKKDTFLNVLETEFFKNSASYPCHLSFLLPLLLLFLHAHIAYPFLLSVQTGFV